MSRSLGRWRNARHAIVAIVAGLLSLAPMSAQCQAVRVLPARETPIPRQHYKSWSLFLVSNPEWVLPESNDRLQKLYDRFEAFGRAIGSDHVAVWFWSEPPEDANKLATAVDVLRSNALCQRLKLPPSRGPYVLVTTEYPGEALLDEYPKTFPEKLENYQVIELNGANAAETSQLLGKLADQLILGEFRKLDPKAESFWRAWQKSFEATRGQLVGFSKKVQVTINTSFFTAALSL